MQYILAKLFLTSEVVQFSLLNAVYTRKLIPCEVVQFSLLQSRHTSISEYIYGLHLLPKTLCSVVFQLRHCTLLFHETSLSIPLKTAVHCAVRDISVLLSRAIETTWTHCAIRVIVFAHYLLPTVLAEKLIPFAHLHETIFYELAFCERLKIWLSFCLLQNVLQNCRHLRPH